MFDISGGDSGESSSQFTGVMAAVGIAGVVIMSSFVICKFAILTEHVGLIAGIFIM